LPITTAPGPSSTGASARDVERAIGRRTGGEDHRVVKLHEFLDRDLLADGHVADEADVVGQCDRLVAARHVLDRLMVGRDARPDQPERHRQAIDDIDADIVAERLLARLGGVIAGGSRSDYRHMPHRPLPVDPTRT
jgi:hypothetical protein